MEKLRQGNHARYEKETKSVFVPVMYAAGALTAKPALGSNVASALSAQLYRAQTLAAQ